MLLRIKSRLQPLPMHPSITSGLRQHHPTGKLNAGITEKQSFTCCCLLFTSAFQQFCCRQRERLYYKIAILFGPLINCYKRSEFFSSKSSGISNGISGASHSTSLILFSFSVLFLAGVGKELCLRILNYSRGMVGNLPFYRC